MTALWIVLAVLLGLLLLPVILLAVPVRVYLEFDRRLTVKLRVFGVRFCCYDSADQKETAAGTEGEPPSRRTAFEPLRERLSELNRVLQAEGVGGYIAFSRRMLSEAGRTISGIGRAVSVRNLILHATVAAGEPDETALLFGRLSAALAAAQTLLSQTVALRRSEVRIAPDFLSDSPSVYVYAVVRICPLRMLWAAGRGFFRIWGYTKHKLAEASPSAQGG